MDKFQFLNYHDVNKRLNDLVNNRENKISVKKEYPIGFTDFNLPIDHYTMGSGPKHIIVTGSYHASEIITTIFLVQLMEDLASSKDSFNIEEYTIHFIPMVNPEGYLITTEMQSLYLNKGETEEEKIALARDYYQKYRSDAILSTQANKVLRDSAATLEQKEEAVRTLRGKKQYQSLFDDISEEEFLKDYPELRKSVRDILNNNGYPIGVCAAWSANGHGVDLSQNVPFNVNLPVYQKSREPIYGANAYTNLRKDRPGPINAICRDLDNFTFEKENLHMLEFLAQLNKRSNGQIVGFVNYHSVMGKIYQRPVKDQGMLDLYGIDYSDKLVENYVGARLFREENGYDIIEEEDPYSYINEYFRLRYGVNIQVELSRMGSNPIGPLADPQTFSDITVKPNIFAFKKFVGNLGFIKEYTRLVNYLSLMYQEKNAKELDAKKVYRIIDRIITTNPSLYTKLREEINNPLAYNSHVISYLFQMLDQSFKQGIEESSNIKHNLFNHDSKDMFTVSYTNFIDKLVNRLNAKRNNPLSKEEVMLLFDNICRDYPEVFARLRWALSEDRLDLEVVKELYNRLQNLLNNQEQMGNLIRR